MIRGIDSQVMINKSIDYSRQMSNHAAEQEHGKEFTAELQKSKIAIQNNSVQETKQSEGERVHAQDNAQDDQSDRRKKRKRRLVAVQDTDSNEIQMTPEEEALGRLPRRLPKNERDLGGSIDINV